MKKLFEEYGSVIVVVIAIVALITLVITLMQPSGPMGQAFDSIIQSFVDKTTGASGGEDGAGGAGGSGGEEGSTGTGLRYGEKYTDSSGTISGVFYEDGDLDIYLSGMFYSYADEFYALSGNVLASPGINAFFGVSGDWLVSDDGSSLTNTENNSLVLTCAGNGNPNMPEETLKYGSTYSHQDGTLITFNADGSGRYKSSSSEFTFSVGSITFNEVSHGINGACEVGDVSGTWSRDGKKVYLSISNNDPEATESVIFSGMLTLVESGDSGGEETEVAGLYRTGSNYTEQLKTWQELLDERVVYVENGAVYTNATLSGTNSSSAALAGDLLLPNDGSVTRLGTFDIDTFEGNMAFASCTELTGIQIPDCVTDVGHLAFVGCTSLTSIDLPSGVQTIGYRAFADCTGLLSANLPGVVTIGQNAFQKCSALATVSLGADLTKIESGVFLECTALNAINFAGTVGQWNNVSLGNNWCYGPSATRVYCEASGEYVDIA